MRPGVPAAPAEGGAGRIPRTLSAGLRVCPSRAREKCPPFGSVLLPIVDGAPVCRWVEPRDRPPEQPRPDPFPGALAGRPAVVAVRGGASPAPTARAATGGGGPDPGREAPHCRRPAGDHRRRASSALAPRSPGRWPAPTAPGPWDVKPCWTGPPARRKRCFSFV